MRAIHRAASVIAAVVFAQSHFGGNAHAQNSADLVCKYFSKGAVYQGTEYRDGRNVGITITYIDCIEIGTSSGAPKVMLTFERQESGSALQKNQWLEFVIQPANAVEVARLKWLNFSGFYKEKTREVSLLADGSYLEQLVYMSGSKSDIKFRPKN